MTNRQQIRRMLLLIVYLSFPVTIFYFSPVLIILGAAGGIITGSFIIFLLMFLAALFFGRAFCGWLCPAGGLQEICTLINDKPTMGGKYNIIKYLLWIPWISVIAYCAIIAGGLHTLNPWFGTKWGISVTQPFDYIIFYLFTGLIVILSLMNGRRGFCHYVCWMAPFMIIGDKIGNYLKINVIRLTSDKAKCINCKKCSHNCAMSLPVRDMVQNNSMGNSECVLCGVCVDTCPQKAISFAVFKKRVICSMEKNI